MLSIVNPRDQSHSSPPQHELLAGSTPFDAKELMASGLDAMVKTIREKEPVRPCTREKPQQNERIEQNSQPSHS